MKKEARVMAAIIIVCAAILLGGGLMWQMYAGDWTVFFIGLVIVGVLTFAYKLLFGEEIT